MNENTTTQPEDLAAVARVLFDVRGDTEALVVAMSEEARRLIPGTQSAGVVVVNRGQVEQTTARRDLAGICDALQTEFEEGPSLSAAHHHQSILIANLSSDTRWPQFARAATTAGAGAMMSVPFEAGVNQTATANFYSTSAYAFSDLSRVAAELFTAHAAIAFAAGRENEQLLLAVDSRDTIGQAKGMLMERFDIGADQAFALLRRLSQDSNVKLAQLAQRVVDTGSDVDALPTESST